MKLKSILVSSILCLRHPLLHSKHLIGVVKFIWKCESLPATTRPLNMCPSSTFRDAYSHLTVSMINETISNEKDSSGREFFIIVRTIYFEDWRGMYLNGALLIIVWLVCDMNDSPVIDVFPLFPAIRERSSGDSYLDSDWSAKMLVKRSLLRDNDFNFWLKLLSMSIIFHRILVKLPLITLLLVNAYDKWIEI